MTHSSRQLFFSELFGTFFLVFVGTGAIISNELSGGALGLLGITMTFGLIVLALIYAIGDISGAHFNPAVTLAFVVDRCFPVDKVALYISAQTIGAVAASLCLRVIFPNAKTLGETLPSGNWLQSFVLEFLVTLILMFVILCVASGPKNKGIPAGIVIGGTITLLALFSGPICGASMNPVRSLGPALVLGNFNSLWIYIVAPILGALCAVPVTRLIRDKEADARE